MRAVIRANNKLWVKVLCLKRRLTNLNFLPNVEFALSISGSNEPTQTKIVAGALQEHKAAKVNPAARCVVFVNFAHLLWLVSR